MLWQVARWTLPLRRCLYTGLLSTEHYSAKCLPLAYMGTVEMTDTIGAPPNLARRVVLVNISVGQQFPL